MKVRTFVTHALAAAAGIAVVSALAAGPARPAEQEGHQQMDPKAMQAAMEAWMKTTRPGQEHKFLEQFAGEWDTTMRMWMDPNGKPSESKGSATLKMIHGGRFLHQESKGSMKLPGPDGKMMDVPSGGMGVTGFDVYRKLYTFAWTDTMSTAILTGSGALDRSGKILTMFGQMDEPMTGETGKAVKYVTRASSPDKFTFEIYEVLYGDPFKVVEVEYTRKK
jgi:hypothetical protein